jgi:hypothetical protein
MVRFMNSQNEFDSKNQVTYLRKSPLVFEFQVVHIGDNRSLSLGNLIILTVRCASGILAYDADQILKLFHSHDKSNSGKQMRIKSLVCGWIEMWECELSMSTRRKWFSLTT